MFEWLVDKVMSLVVQALSYAVSLFTETFGFDLTYFSEKLPLLKASYDIFQTMALGFVMLFFIWQCLKAFGAPIGIEGDDPIKIFFKSILAVFCIYNAQGLINYGFTALKPVYDMINGLEPAATIEWGFDYYNVEAGVVDTVAVFTGMVLWQSVVFGVLLIIVLWNLLKMLIELTERYILLGILAVTSPLGFSTMTTKATANIFAAWMRMMIGQFVVYLLNFWIIKMFLNAFGEMPPVSQLGESVMWFVFMWAFLKVAQKLDTFIGKLGIEVGSVGGSLFEEIMIGKMAFGAITKGAGGGGKGKDGGAIASAMSAVTGGRSGGSVLASALAGGVAVGAGGAVGRAAMGVLGKVTKGSLLGGLLTNGNPFNGGKQNLGANVANAMPAVARTKASSAAKILNENPMGGGDEFSKKLQSLTSQNGVTPNLVNQLNRDVGGERGKQIMSGLIGKKSFGDLTPEMVNSQCFEATAFQGGVKWSYKDSETNLSGIMAVHGNNSATEAADKLKNKSQDSYHYTSNAAGGRKISCVYTKSTASS